jgi:hypothetical protein
MADNPVVHALAGSCATLRALGDSSAIRGTLDATVVALDGRRLSLTCALPVPRSTAVRVDVNGALFLGEVALPQTTPGSATIIDIQQVVPSVPDLARLMQGLFGEAGAASSRQVTALTAR